MRQISRAWLSICFVLTPLRLAHSQEPAAIRTYLSDTSQIRRAVALYHLQREPSSVRRAAVARLMATLADSSADRRFRAMVAIPTFGTDAAGAVTTLQRIAGDSDAPLQAQALMALGILGPAVAPLALPTLQMAGRNASAGVRAEAAAALLQFRDSVHGGETFRSLLGERIPYSLRINALRQLAVIGDTAALLPLRLLIADTAFRRRADAVTALGLLGPKARSAMPALVAMLSDTFPRRIERPGNTWQVETGAAYAAWALSQIVPLTSAGANSVVDPLHAQVAGAPYSLRNDGLGVYAWGVDSVSVFWSSGFFLHLSPPTAARGPYGPERAGFRRSLSFDLSQPIPGSGARSRGVIRDNEAYVWIWYRRDPSYRVSTFREIAVSDSAHTVERIELHFRIGDVQHVLQMGPMVEGQGGATAWFTGVHGDGTTPGELVHPATGRWTVRAPEGSKARLWSFEDRTRPIDRGLYAFSLEIAFMAPPGGPAGSCVPYVRCF